MARQERRCVSLQLEAVLTLLVIVCLSVELAWPSCSLAAKKSSSKVTVGQRSRSSKVHRPRHSASLSNSKAGSNGQNVRSKRTHRLDSKKTDSSASEHRKAHGKVSDEGLEPKAMPPNYEAETRLLAKAYQLRDQALNEQMRGDLGDAVKHLSEATEISNEYYQGEPSPAEAQLYFELAVAAESAGQNALADKSFSESIKRNPRAAEPRVRYATLLAKLGNAEQAIAEARLATGADPADPRPHSLLAVLLERKGELEEADAEKARAKALLSARPVPKPEPCRVKTAEPIPAGEPPDLPESSESQRSKDSEELPADTPLGLP